MMKLYRFLFLIFVIVCGAGFFEANAQTMKVTGQVISSDDGTPMPGVNVLEKGTSNGTATDSDGNFTITVNSSSVLTFSFVGYLIQETPVTGRQVINVTLEPNVSALNEIVVIGYGQVERKDVTGAIQTISTKDFNRGVISSPQDLIVGKVAGVQITSDGGAPGSNSVIRIRGGSSLNSTNDPLIVIDGMAIDQKTIGGVSNSLSSIVNPNDIESINILKDASATAIYGSRASNGVIIITTKKGTRGKMKLNYNGNFSLSQPIAFVDVLNANELKSVVGDLVEKGQSGFSQATNDLFGSANTDWQKEIYRTAFSQDHSISASGTAANIPYRVSYGFTDEQGILKNTDINRHTVNVSLTPKLLNDRLHVTANVKGSVSKNNFGNTGAVGAAVAFDPTQPIHATNDYGNYFAWLETNGEPVSGATGNPVAMINQKHNVVNVNRLIGSLQLDYDIPSIEGLRATVNGAFDIAKSDGKNYDLPTSAWSYKGKKIDYTHENTNKQLDLYLNYKREFGVSKIDVTGGHSAQYFTIDGTNFDRNWDGTQYNAADFAEDGVTRIPRKNNRDLNVLLSFFGRVTYNFDDRFLLTGTLRNDISSRYSKEHRSGFFPSAAIAWNLMNEKFLEESSSLSNLKLRLSYGETGQQYVDNNPYPYLPLYKVSSATAQYQLGTPFYYTYRPSPYDASFQWETAITYNAALDFGFLNDRLTGTIDVYKRKTENMIAEIPVAAGSNLSNFLFTNVSSMENKGVEVLLNYGAIQRDDVKLNVGVNFTYNENEITKLLAVDDPNFIGNLVGGITGGVGNNVQINRVGHAANSFALFRQVYDADGKPIEGLYVDRLGKGGAITGDDNNRFVDKSPLPTYTFGINANLQYKSIDFGFSGRASIGNYVYNNNLSARSFYSTIYDSRNYLANIPKDMLDVRFSTAQYTSDLFLENASFFKMDYISAGYNFDQLFTEKLKARIGFTKYSGLDPEVHSGIDNNIYPRPRIYMLSLNLTY
jgi:TonB-linked SusC/RagA family outer membrane protein